MELLMKSNIKLMTVFFGVILAVSLQAMDSNSSTPNEGSLQKIDSIINSIQNTAYAILLTQRAFGVSSGENATKSLKPLATTINFEKLNREIPGPIRALALFYKYPDKYKFKINGIVECKKPLSGIVLYGEPGCGKTELMRALAGEGVPVFAFSGSEFQQPYVGQSETMLRNLYNNANSYRYDGFINTIFNIPKHPLVVVFLDEIDSIGQQRGGVGSKYSDSLLNQLLTLLDGTTKYDNIVTIVSTNRPDLLDSALTRSKRLSIKVEVKNPTKEEKLKIIKSKFDLFGLQRTKSLDNLINGKALDDLGTADCAEITEICRTVACTHKILSEEIKTFIGVQNDVVQEKRQEREYPLCNFAETVAISYPFYDMSFIYDEIQKKEKRLQLDQVYDQTQVSDLQAAFRGYLVRKAYKDKRSDQLIRTQDFKEALAWMGKDKKEIVTHHMYI